MPMQSDVDNMIERFLQRKDQKFPDMELLGRHESRTVKYDTQLSC